MGSRTSPPCHEPTGALRERSPERLLDELTRYMVAAEPDAPKDFRDVLVGFAPYFDCAQRLGVDPVGLFEAASLDCGPLMRELAATFARRTDVTLAAFGWRLADRAGGPCYRPQGS